MRKLEFHFTKTQEAIALAEKNTPVMKPFIYALQADGVTFF